MSTVETPELPAETAAAPADTLQVDMGKSLPPQATASVPLLRPRLQGLPAPDGEPSASITDCTTLSEGLHFTGVARLAGPCCIGGSFEGNIEPLPGCQVAVVITASGRLEGDVSAQKISVMGHTHGLLDAGTGEVSLHDNARVQGRVRYGRIVVNGADLNATLERVSDPMPRKS